MQIRHAMTMTSRRNILRVRSMPLLYFYDKLFASLQGAFPLPESWDAEKTAEVLIYDFSAARGDDTSRLASAIL